MRRRGASLAAQGRRAHATTWARAARAVMGLALFAGVEAAAQYPPVVTRSRLDPARGVNFHAILLPDTVYVGQQATYQIGVFLNQEVRQRLRRNPEFVPPETRSLLVYDLPDARAPLVGTIDGRQYEVHIFQRAFFAMAPGRYDVPPSRLTYALPQTASFFSREESHTLRSESRTLTVLPVPTAGRPSDWSGAVGEWRASLRVDSARGRVGDPVVVTWRIEGRGNVALLPRPRLIVDWATVVAADERVELDSTPSTLRGAKEFDWLVTPRVAGRRTIAAQRYPFFNPAARRFEIAWSAPVAISVDDGVAVSTDSLGPAATDGDVEAPAAPLSLRASLGDGARRSWIRSPWFLLVMLLAPLPALVSAFRHRRRRPRRARTNAEELKAAARRDTDGAAARRDGDAAAARRLMHQALRDRLQCDVGLSLGEGTLVSDLRREGVTSATAERAEQLLRALERAVFGDLAPTAPPSAEVLWSLYQSIDAEARRRDASTAQRRGGAARALALAGLLTLGGATVLMARQGDDTAFSWASGQSAFAGAEYGKAERHFLDVTRTLRDHPNAWANLGSAAFMAADTAHAVQGWQRALRLAPLDAELRSRLARVRAVQDRGAARVPYVPVSLPPALLLLVWTAGWIWVARRAAHRRPIRGRAYAVTALGVALAVWAWQVDAALRARDLVVVARPEPLRTLPVLGADQGPAPLTGEVARVLQRQGAWAHVRLDGDREGWIAAELLLPLGDD